MGERELLKGPGHGYASSACLPLLALCAAKISFYSLMSTFAQPVAHDQRGLPS